jgi:hypothetical protein
MTKAELARRLAWRCKVMQHAGERSRNIALPSKRAANRVKSFSLLQLPEVW